MFEAAFLFWVASCVMRKDLNFAFRFEANFIWTRTEEIEYTICALVETIQPAV